MKCAIIFYSETGNTEKLAKVIRQNIEFDEIDYIDLNETTDVPKAEVYFVGFPVQRQSCSMRILDVLESLEEGNVALFATCGMYPSEKYKKKLEDTFRVWISDSVNYMGMFLCQGQTDEKQKDNFYRSNPELREKVEQMLKKGDGHPNYFDLEDVAEFAQGILEFVE